jgi:hypothetical protein
MANPGNRKVEINLKEGQMLQSMRHGIRFIPLAAALVALIVFAPTVLGQDGRIKCNDGRLVSSAADCLVPAEAGMEDEDGMSMEDEDGMSMEDEDGMSMEDEDGMSMGRRHVDGR